MLNGTDIVEILDRIANRMIEQADYLSELDAVNGDAEHGINMKKGFSALKAELTPLSGLLPGAILLAAGKTIMSKTGGSAGALYGTAFLEASKAAAQRDSLDASAVGAMIQGALDGMMRRGGAQPGDKTMIDTIFPANAAFQHELENGADLAACMAAAEHAAKAGMESTKDMVAQKGRASYQGESSKGSQDPGATSMYYCFEQANEYLRQRER